MNKKAKTTKPNWEKPELVILTHSNEDEVLTLDCKLVTTGAVGAAHSNNKCDKPKNKHNPCGACQAQNGGS